jgi:CDP-glucose 4,6-dehydratase
MENMEKLNKSRILVTGGSGFIGSHLVEELVKQGADILVIDIASKPNSYFAKQKLHKKVRLEFQDIAHKTKMERLFLTFNPEYVFHLAAEAIVDESYNDPYTTFKTNIMGTVSILEAARKSETIKGIVVASSDKAYGKTKEAYTEESPLKGDHPYDVSKSAADLISQTYYSTYGLPVTVTRFGNIYGEGDLHFNRIIPGICESIILDKTLLIRSDGKYVRDYIYVKDVVSGYLILMQNIAKVKGEAFNFSSNDTFSVIEVVAEVEKAMNKKIPYKIMNNAKNEIPYQHLNDSKIRKLGWESQYSLKDIIPQVINWYKHIL